MEVPESTLGKLGLFVLIVLVFSVSFWVGVALAYLIN
jgi:hypothetical protein